MATKERLVELLLAEIATGARPQRSLGIHRFRVHREHERRSLRVASLQGLHESEAVIAPLEAKVDDHQIGRAAARPRGALRHKWRLLRRPQGRVRR